LDADSADVLLTLGSVQQLVGNYDEAIESYKRAIALNPNSAEAAFGLGDVYSGRRQLVAAEQAYRRAINLRPTWWSSHNQLGLLLMNQRRYDDAANEFREVVRLNPQNSWGYMNLGVVSVDRGNLQEASTIFEKAASLGAPGAYSNLGYCYYYLGDYDEAAAYDRKAIDLAPSVAVRWANLGDACLWSTTCRQEAPAAYAQAIELLRRDLQVNPNSARAHGTLAVCLAKSGRMAEAREHMKRALEIDPQNPTRMYQAARVANASQNPDEAITWLHRAIAAGYQLFELDRDPEFGALRSTKAYRDRITTTGSPT
jgi:tetratricopeptide (TPR) repeat protein